MKTAIRVVCLTAGLILLLTGIVMSLARTQTPQPAAVLILHDNGGGTLVDRQWRDGTGRRPVLDAPGSVEDYRSIIWSPDGRWIYFIDYGIYRALAHTGKIDAFAPELFAGGLHFSSDGERLLCYAYDNGVASIFALDADANPQRLTEARADDISPMPSPDGKWIIFASWRDQNWDIFRMPAAGGEVENLTRTPEDEYFPQWSADGHWIYFETALHQYSYMSPDGTRRGTLDGTPDLPDPLRAPVIDLPFRAGIIDAGGFLLLVAGLRNRRNSGSPAPV